MYPTCTLNLILNLLAEFNNHLSILIYENGAVLNLLIVNIYYGKQYKSLTN